MAEVMKVGFTGTQSGMSPLQKEKLRYYLMKLMGLVEFHHGDCIGADDEAANIAWECGHDVVGHPPTDEKKRAFNKHTDRWEELLPYLQRNRAMVDAVALMYAAPKTQQPQQRSGTWSTIRYAEQSHKALFVIYP